MRLGSVTDTSGSAGTASSSSRFWLIPFGAGGAICTTGVFARARRLVIETDGQVAVYDSGDHEIGSVSQQKATAAPSPSAAKTVMSGWMS
jgi:hypothetical protein